MTPEDSKPLPQSSDTRGASHLAGSASTDGIATLKSSAVTLHDSPPRPDAAKHSVSDGVPLRYESSNDDDIEDYDAITLDPDTLVEGSRGGLRRASNNARPGSRKDQDHARIRRQSEPLDGRLDSEGRRQSIQIRLERTDKKGNYILTADDPEIRDILRRGIEREEAAAANTPKARSRFRDLVFTRQFTTFDRQNPINAESPFHGFFTLFWLAMVLMFLKVSAANYRDYGSILGKNEVMKMMFSRDIFVLGLTDIAMLFSTLFGFFLHKAIARGFLTWTRSGWIIENVWQTFFLASIIGWIYYRDWPWTHTIFMVLHMLVFIMKQHSYTFYNGHLSSIYRRKQKLQQKLQQLKDMDSGASRPNPLAGPPTANSSSIDVQDEPSQAKRPSLGLRTSTSLSKETSDVANVAAAMESGQPLDVDQMHAFERVIQAEMDGLDQDLRGKCTTTDNSYPKNLTLGNFLDWTCLPTLVYELEYPRQEKINWYSLLEKTIATFGVIGVMQVISQAYIYPPVSQTVAMKAAGLSLQERAIELPWVISDILFPLLLEQLLAWYVIWVS